MRLTPRLIGALVLIMSRSDALTAADFPTVDQLPQQSGLPDPLKMRDGRPVTTAEQWRTERRPELLQLFQHYMYGVAPKPLGITAKVTKTVDSVFDGQARLKEIEIRFNGLPDNAPRLHLAVFVPKNAKGRLPVFLGINKCGNQETVFDEAVTPTTSWQHANCGKAPPRGGDADFWCAPYILSRGYAFATFHESDLDPDQHDWTDGIHPFYPDLPAAPESRWGTIAAWAWGFSRCADYLVTDADIDPNRICIIGHSRRGKTALFAAAMDERFALVVPHQSGTGGMALSRDSQQEKVERINRAFPHWFNDKFTEFNDQEDRLPFDQHCLVALIAPRPLLDTEGAQDAWANFPRSLDGLRAADPVYKLLGAKGVVGTGLVQNDEPIVGPNFGTLLQYRLDEKHTLNEKFWAKILDFADAALKK
ncbi:MAG: acetylxylan esterase [Planctomycetaceae bacterium]|nr:acetylxylan esterase [Planctomycetaceae bacterium]